jgi:hypothetical protein
MWVQNPDQQYCGTQTIVENASLEEIIKKRDCPTLLPRNVGDHLPDLPVMRRAGLGGRPGHCGSGG